MSGITFLSKLEDSNFRPSGFDYLRIALSCAVVFWHSFGISYGPSFTAQVSSGPFRGLVALILPMFFGLSGFLVAGSLLRCKSLISFLGLRIIRIFPALVVETVISALLIGPIFTKLSLLSYFSDPVFYKYMMNIFGIIHFNLPGVLNDNPFSGIVNGQLWTVPYELECYVVISLCSVAGAVKHRSWILIGLFSLTSILFAHQLRNFYLYDAMPVRDAVTGRHLVVSFVAGVAGFLYKDKLAYNSLLGFGSLIGAYILFIISPLADTFAVLLATYFVLWIGAKNPRKIFILNSSDYSYGIFLYGFAVQQCVKSVAPDFAWWANFLVSLTIVSVIAAMSWHFVEKPALSARKFLMVLEERLLGVLGRTKGL